MHVLRDELKNVEVTISSDYSPDLAEALVRGRLMGEIFIGGSNKASVLRAVTEDYLRR